MGRRQLLQISSSAAVLIAAPSSALAAKGPRGFQQVVDSQDNYQFLYPFGWQEVSVQGADVVFKDVVEPLESVSVTLTTTDKTDISEFGGVQEVTEAIARNVLTAPGQKVTFLKSSQRADAKGRNYYDMQWTADTGKYVRHSVAVVAVDNGIFYTLTTGANERRWNKMEERLYQIINSFSLIN
ncbi:MAG: hypothetical protein WDW38_004249 [Sanguina aurantia]